MFSEEQGHNEVGISDPSSACGLYLGFALREWQPNSTQGHGMGPQVAGGLEAFWHWHWSTYSRRYLLSHLASSNSGARLTKYHTIYRKIISSLS